MTVRDWYTSYINKSGERYNTFLYSLELLNSRCTEPLIVETGTLRQENDFGAGYSTYIFGEYVSLFGGRLITIDISAKNIDTSKRLTEKFKENITYICEDSLIYLNGYTSEKIDYLYLDSFDCPLTGDATDAQLHNLHEFKSAEPFLSKNAIIVIDDANLENGGKSRLTHQYLSDRGYIMSMFHQQSVWEYKK